MNEIDNKISEALKNTDLEIELESANGEFTFTYSTNIVAKEIENPTTLTRGYWLTQNNTLATINAPWDTYEHEKQVILASNLIKYGNYKLKSISNGWTITCPNCKKVIEGKIWRNSPKNCENGCGTEFKLSDKKKKLVNF